MGRGWYDDGKMLKKKNTFTDFIDCAEYLVAEKYTFKEGLFAMGGSAGGMLMGAISNMRPDLFKGIIAYVPGNLYPIMVTDSLSGTSASTIIEGVAALIHHGSYTVAAVVFVASIIVPVAKFAVIAWLALTIHFQWTVSKKRRIEAYEAIEFIGRWSMVDVFVVAALAALIQVGGLMSIAPGIGINAFALSVVFTMLSAMSFDPRQIWDEPSV